MRILALATEAFGGKGGIAQANRDLFQALADLNDIDVLTRHSDEDFFVLGRIRQARPHEGKMAYALNAMTAAGRKSYDVIFCGHLYMAPLAFLMGRMSGLPVWLHLHGLEAWHRPDHFIRTASEKCRLVTTVSRYTRRKFLSWSRVSPDRVKVLPNTVEERFSPGPASEALLNRYQLKNRRILLTVGRLSSKERLKGQDRVISVLPSLLKSFPDLVYAIAGEGDDRPRLSELARNLGVESYVKFLGQVEDARLPELYRSSDVFVMPAKGEGFGIVFLEAAACGLPVVGGNADGSFDALLEGRLGATVDPDDAYAIEKAIRTRLISAKEPSSAVLRYSRANQKPFVESLLRTSF